MGITVPVSGNASTKYLEINKALQKAPVYICSFGPITGPLGTNYQPLMDEYCTGYVQNSTKIRKVIMSFPSGVSSEFNPITYQATVSSLTFDLQDNNSQYPNEATRIITNYILKNRWVTVKRGFQGLDELDYKIVYMGQVNDVYLNSNQTGYTFEVFDARKQVLTNTVLSGHTTLTSGYQPGNTSIICADATYFPFGSVIPSGSYVNSLLKMGNNLFSYTGISNSGSIPDGSALWKYVGPGGFIQLVPVLQKNSVVIPGNIYCSGGWNWEALGSSVGNTLPYASSGEVVGQHFDTNYNLVAWEGYDQNSYIQWVPNTVVALGDVCSNMGNRYVCVQAGTTEGSGGPLGNGGSGGLFTGLSLIQPDGQGESPAVAQQPGANVDNVFRIQGHPIDIILGLLMSTGTGNNNPPRSPAPSNVPLYSTTGIPNYDVNYSNSGAPGSAFGIGIPWWQINIPNFLAQKTLMGPMTAVGYFTAEEVGLKFIENYFLEQFHISLFTNSQGQVDCRAIFPNLDMTGASTLDQTNIIGKPQFDGHLQSNGYFYNELFIKYDYQLAQDYYKTIDVTPYSPSLAAYQEAAQLTIYGRFFNTSSATYGGTALSTRCKNTYLSRFSSPPPVITCKCFDMFSVISPYDPIILNHPDVPNYLTGSKGGPINCQVVKTDIDWKNGYTTLTLLAVGWYSPVSIIAPPIHNLGDIHFTGGYAKTSSNIPAITGAFTLRGWVSSDIAYPNNLGIATLGNLGGNYGNIKINAYDLKGTGNCQFRVEVSNLVNFEIDLQGITNIYAGTKYFVEFAWSPTAIGGKNCWLFVNGSLEAFIQLPSVLTLGPNPLALGAYYDTLHNWPGRLWQWELSNIVRHTVGYAPPKSITPDANTIAFYGCQEGTGTVLNDTSGNGHNMNLVPYYSWDAAT